MALITPGVNGDFQSAVTTQILNKASVTGKSINRFSAIDIPNNTFTRDSNFWLSALDFSCLAVWNSNTGGAQKGGVLITNQHIIVAHHYPLSIGDQVAFIGNDDIIYKRTVIEVFPRAPEPTNFYSSDYDICKLNATLPSSVVPIVLPSQDFFSILQGTGNTSTFSLATSCPIITTNQFNQFGAGSLNILNTSSGGNATANITSPYNTSPYINYGFSIIPGDSGHPTFMPLANGRLMLLTTWTTPIAGPAHPIAYLGSHDTFGNVTETGWVAKLGGASLTFVNGYNTYDTTTPVVTSESFNTYLQRKLNEKMPKVPFGMIGHGVVIADTEGNLKDSGSFLGGISTPTNSKISYDNFINLNNFTNNLLLSNNNNSVGLWQIPFNMVGDTLGNFNFTYIISLDLDLTTSNPSPSPGGPYIYLGILIGLFGDGSGNSISLRVDQNANIVMQFVRPGSQPFIIGNISNFIGKEKIFALSFIYKPAVNKYYVYINSSLLYSNTPPYTMSLNDIPRMSMQCTSPNAGAPFTSGNNIICHGMYVSNGNNNTYLEPIYESIDWLLNGRYINDGNFVKINLTPENISTNVWLNKGSAPDFRYSGPGTWTLISTPIPYKNSVVTRTFKTYTTDTIVPGLDAGINEVEVSLNSYESDSKFSNPVLIPNSIRTSLEVPSSSIPYGLTVKDSNTYNSIVMKNDNGSDENSGVLTFDVTQIYF